MPSRPHTPTHTSHTASVDYILNIYHVRYLGTVDGTVGSPMAVAFTARQDQVSQEGDETLTLSLTDITPPVPSSTVLYRTTANVIIEDRTSRCGQTHVRGVRMYTIA